MSDKLLIRFILAGAILTLAACVATSPLTYAPSNNGGAGYFENQRGTYKWMVGSYFGLYNQTPQQAANIVMRRAAEIATQEGFKWIRILNYDTEKHQGPIASLPASMNLESNSILRGMVFYGNQDATVKDSQIPLGVNHALVEYFEFSREAGCPVEKCGTMELFIEQCNDGWNGGTPEFPSRCNEMAIPKKDGSQGNCIDRAPFITKDFCGTVNNAAYNIKGMIEERNPLGVGTWYRTEDIRQKYTIRSEKWATVRGKR